MMVLFAVLLSVAVVAAAVVHEVACRGVSRWGKAIAAWRRMSAAEKAAKKELEDKMERQRQEEIRAEREAEENRRQNARAIQELVHENGTRWRMARVAPSEMVYVQHLDGDRWVTVTAWKRTWGTNEIIENHIKGKSRRTGSQDHPTGWYWYGKQGWGVQLDINFILGEWSVDGQVASPVAVPEPEAKAKAPEPEAPEPEPEPEPEPDDKGKRPDRLEMLD